MLKKSQRLAEWVTGCTYEGWSGGAKSLCALGQFICGYFWPWPQFLLREFRFDFHTQWVIPERLIWKRSQVFIPSNTDSWLLPTLRWFGFLGWYFPSSARVSRFSAHCIYRIFYCTFNTKFTHPLHKSMLNQFKNYCSAFWSLPWYMIVPVFIIIDIIILLLII